MNFYKITNLQLLIQELDFNSTFNLSNWLISAFYRSRLAFYRSKLSPYDRNFWILVGPTSHTLHVRVLMAAIVTGSYLLQCKLSLVDWRQFFFSQNARRLRLETRCLDLTC